MTKHLLTAVLAIVAVGGATLSANADFFYPEDGNERTIECPEGISDCQIYSGHVNGWDVPADLQTSENATALAEVQAPLPL